MIINKKMRDGSFIEMEVDESQGKFLLKHDPKKYTTNEILSGDIIVVNLVDDIESKIKEIVEMGYSREHAIKVLSE